MKRVVSLLFLAFAVGALMAHSTVPHHHHDSKTIICFLDDCCSECSAAPTNDHCGGGCTHSDAAEHSHGGERRHGGGEGEKCFIEDVYTRNGDDKQTSVSAKGLSAPLCAILLTDMSDPRFMPREGLSFRRNPGSRSCYDDYITRSLGLRAPPVC